MGHATYAVYAKLTTYERDPATTCLAQGSSISAHADRGDVGTRNDRKSVRWLTRWSSGGTQYAEPPFPIPPVA